MVVEPSKGWWTGNSRFGGRFQGVLPAQEGSIIPITSLDYVPGPPRTVALNLYANDTAFVGAPGIANSDVKAQITYGAGGFTNTFRCDWMQGCQFSIVCNSLRVDAVTVKRTNQGVYGNGNIARMLGCTIGLGQSGYALGPQLTTPWTVLLAAGTTIYQIPDFARGLILTSDVIDPLITATFESTAIQQVYDMTTLYASYQGSGIRVPGGPGLVRIRNATAAPAGHQLIWLMSL